jgi:hypothetical protein
MFSIDVYLVVVLSKSGNCGLVVGEMATRRWVGRVWIDHDSIHITTTLFRARSQHNPNRIVIGLLGERLGEFAFGVKTFEVIQTRRNLMFQEAL